MFSDVIIGNYDTIVKSPLGNYAKEVSNRIYDKVIIIFRYYKLLIFFFTYKLLLLFF